MRFVAVLPAAGIGRRIGAECPKQYLLVAGHPILSHSLRPFLYSPIFSQVVVVLHPRDRWFKQLAESAHPKVVAVEGGVRRADSVLAALNTIDKNSWVVVHDAARPCLSMSDLDKILDAARRQQGAILASPICDTVKLADRNQYIQQTISRDRLWYSLTPQSFSCRLLRKSLRVALQAGINVTDEASAMEWAGHPVQLIVGQNDNIKVTHPEDLALAEFLISRRS